MKKHRLGLLAQNNYLVGTRGVTELCQLLLGLENAPFIG